MTRAWRGALWAIAGWVVGVWLAPVSVQATEYRLQVASLYEDSFSAFLGRGELDDGAPGPGLDRLATSLARGEVSSGVLLYDRPLQIVREGIVRAYGGVPIRDGAVRRGGFDHELWDEARWEGQPGEQSVWVVGASTAWPQELYRVALGGTGPLRQFRPYLIPATGQKYPAVKFPLDFLWAQEERGTVWQKYVSRVLDLQNGIGAVVAVNHNPVFADSVYLILRQADQPTTYKAVLAWRRRKNVDQGFLESGPSFR